MSQIDNGVELTKDIIKDSNRVVMPGDNNNHTDHQATHNIVKRAAIELNLVNTEFYVYAIHNAQKTPMEKQVKIKIADYRYRIYEIMKLYKTQLLFKISRISEVLSMPPDFSTVIWVFTLTIFSRSSLSKPFITAITTIKAITPRAIPRTEIKLIKEINRSLRLATRYRQLINNSHFIFSLASIAGIK